MMNIRVEMKNTLDKPIVGPIFWLDVFLLDDDSLFYLFGEKYDF